MSGLFGPSEQDLERLRSTVESLGTTSVPGLSAALSWRERKTERLLAHELNRPGTPLAYDPGRRTVRWARAPPAAPPATEPAPTPPIRSFTARAPAPPPPVLTATGLKTLCPACHVALQATGSTNLAVCPNCGRLASVRSTPAEPSPRAAAPPLPAPAATPAPGPAAGPGREDRRSQELFAAWVTAQPIPCPKCRTPLRHRGIGEYTCAACGQTVTFGKAPDAPAAPIPAR
jgi:uncharacterized Zn finger protein (UPF0148 family)